MQEIGGVSHQKTPSPLYFQFCLVLVLRMDSERLQNVLQMPEDFGSGKGEEHYWERHLHVPVLIRPPSGWELNIGIQQIPSEFLLEAFLRVTKGA